MSPAASMREASVDPYAIARRVFDALAERIDAAAGTIAASCAAEGRLDTEALDRHQIVSYELALASAQWQTAQSALLGTEDRADLDRRLAITFAAEAAQSIDTRLRRMMLSNAVDEAPDGDWRQLQAAGLAPAILEDLGAAVIAADGAVGHVALDDDKQMMAEMFARFGQEVVAPLSGDIHRQDRTVPDSLLDAMRELGIFGLSIPARYGGSAPDNHDDNLAMIVVTEMLSEASLAAAGSLITRPEILARALLAGGTADQRAQFLPRIAAGDPLCAIAITEPDFGSDVAGLALRATRAGEGWRLNGRKTWCTFAGKAGLLLVIARTDPDRSIGHRGLSAFLVEKPSFDGHRFEVQQPGGGVLRGEAIATIGYRGMHSFELSFEDFLVPADHLIGGEKGLGRGFYLTMTGLTGGRMQTAARACGVMRAALKAAIRYARDRIVFGQPLGAFQLTRARIAQMAASYAACRHLTYAVGRSLDRGGDEMAASQAKLFACRSAERVTRDALQIHGGMGYAEESAVSRYFVDARVLSIFEGAEETLALKVVARGLMQRALDTSR